MAKKKGDSLLLNKIKESCIFCKIIKGEEEAKILFENEEVICFPPLKEVVLAEGHILIVPKSHYENIFDIPREVLNSVIQTAKIISNKLKSEEFEGVNLLHASGKAAQRSINHFHLHLIPRKDSDGRNMWPDSDYKENSYEEVYNHIERIIS